MNAAYEDLRRGGPERAERVRRIVDGYLVPWFAPRTTTIADVSYLMAHEWLLRLVGRDRPGSHRQVAGLAGPDRAVTAGTGSWAWPRPPKRPASACRPCADVGGPVSFPAPTATTPDKFASLSLRSPPSPPSARAPVGLSQGYVADALWVLRRILAFARANGLFPPGFDPTEGLDAPLADKAAARNARPRRPDPAADARRMRRPRFPPPPGAPAGLLDPAHHGPAHLRGLRDHRRRRRRPRRHRPTRRPGPRGADLHRPRRPRPDRRRPLQAHPQDRGRLAGPRRAAQVDGAAPRGHRGVPHRPRHRRHRHRPPVSSPASRLPTAPASTPTATPSRKPPRPNRSPATTSASASPPTCSARAAPPTWPGPPASKTRCGGASWDIAPARTSSGASTPSTTPTSPPWPRSPRSSTTTSPSLSAAS